MWTAQDFYAGEFARGQKLPPPQTGKMTEQKLTALLREGYGQGHLQRYKPWLRVTKRDFSPNSIIGHHPALELGRLHHPRSIAERKTIQLVKWLGAIDVREQYPIWPWEHAHPGEGLLGFENCGRVRGLMDIAREAEIEHGVFAGTNIPYVATLDLLTSWRKENSRIILLALDNKPEGVVAVPRLVSRAKERLELARRYCAECNFRHLIFHAEKLPEELTSNLDALEPRMNALQRQEAIKTPLYREVVQTLNEQAYTRPPVALLSRIAGKRSVDPDKVNGLFRLALWRIDIDHDLSLVLDFSEPLCKGGEQLWKKMRGVLLREDA